MVLCARGMCSTLLLPWALRGGILIFLYLPQEFALTEHATTTATAGNMTSPTHPIASPTKTLHHLPNDLVSPSKKKTENDMVSEDTIQRVKAAIERDPTLKKSNLQDEKPAPLEKFVIVVSNT